MNGENERLRLDPLDPGSDDAGFWDRFHAKVMEQAADELRRRSLAGDLGFADLVFQWRKALVPAALLAAALAGIFVADSAEPVQVPVPMALEEALLEDMEGDALPAFLQQGNDIDELAFLASAGGF